MPAEELTEQYQRDNQTQGEILDETGTHFGKIDVEHHDNEQEKYGNCTYINDHQQHRDELCANQHHFQTSAIKEREDKPKYGVYRVARSDHQQRAADHQTCEKVKG